NLARWEVGKSVFEMLDEGEQRKDARVSVTIVSDHDRKIRYADIASTDIASTDIASANTASLDAPTDMAMSEEHVQTIAEIFNTPLTGAYNWDYTAQDNRIKKLYELGKSLNWNASADIDWDRTLDWYKLPQK